MVPVELVVFFFFGYAGDSLKRFTLFLSRHAPSSRQQHKNSTEIFVRAFLQEFG